MSQIDTQAGARARTMSRVLVAAACLAVMALVASLATKTINLQYSQQTNVCTGGEGVKHQKFEGCGPQWSIAVATYIPPFWPVEVAQVVPTTEPLISFQPHESLYIRPPPVLS